MQRAKTLIRQGRCPGWSESSLGTHSFCWFCHVAAHTKIHHLPCVTKFCTVKWRLDQLWWQERIPGDQETHTNKGVGMADFKRIAKTHDQSARMRMLCCTHISFCSFFSTTSKKLHSAWLSLLALRHFMSPVKRICVFEHSVMTNFNCACPAIQRAQGSGFLSEGSSWLTACMSERRRFRWDCADAQARLKLRCSHRR